MTRLRIRSLKPELFKDEGVGLVSIPARLTYIGLITMADDAGRIRYTPAAVIGHVFSYDEEVTPAKVRRWVEELVKAGLVFQYEVNSRVYLWLFGWRTHQRINRVSPSKLPPPPLPEASWWPHDGNAKPSDDGANVHPISPGKVA